MINCPFCGSEFVKYKKVNEAHYTIKRIKCSVCKTYSSTKKKMPLANIGLKALGPEDFDWSGWTAKDGFIMPKEWLKE